MFTNEKCRCAVAQLILAGLPLMFGLSACAIPRNHSASAARDRAFIVYWPPPENSKRLRLAVKDLIDMKGVDFIAVPTLQNLPPKLPPRVRLFGRTFWFELAVFNSQNTPAVDFAGNPAVAIPVPIRAKSVPVTSLQLVGRRFSEPELLNAGRLIESG